MNKSFMIVVSRYNEDVDWIHYLKEPEKLTSEKISLFKNVVVYNKGSLLDTYLGTQILMQNVGREGHTYYKHICDNYDNLADYTIFIQGYPFDHSPNIISNINNIRPDTEFEFLSEEILKCNLTGCPFHGGLPLIKVFHELFGTETTNLEFMFGAGAQFVVSKNLILQRPKDFYLKIVEMLEKSVNPIEGFVIERFHPLIFRKI